MDSRIYTEVRWKVSLDKHLVHVFQPPGFCTGLFGNKYYGNGESMNNYNGGKYVKLQIWDTAGQERFR